MTAYQGNGSSVAATTVTTANKLAPAVGGTETSNNTTITISTTGWIILRSQGTAIGQTGAGSEPTITDSNNFGWMDDSADFDGQTFATGNWTPKITLQGNLGASVTLDIHCVLLKRPSGGGTYVVVGDIALTGQTLNNTKTTYSLAATSEGSMAFATGDRFCKLWIVNITTGSSSLSTITVFMSNSAATGVAGDAEIVSPGFSATGSSTHKRMSDGYGGIYS